MALYTVAQGGTINSGDINQFTNVLTGADTASVIAPNKIAVGNLTPMRFVGQFATAGPPTTGTWQTNDVGLTTTYNIAVCLAGGTPGSWTLYSLQANSITGYHTAAPPAYSRILLASGSVVGTTDASGQLTLSWSPTFPSSLACVVATNGDYGAGGAFICNVGAVANNSAVAVLLRPGGAAVASTNVRVDFVAMGA